MEWKREFPEMSLLGIIERCAATWRKEDGPPKLHYSDQWHGKPPGSHSASVDLEAFGQFYGQIQHEQIDLDVMLEVKDKQESVLAVYERYFPKTNTFSGNE